MEWSGWKELINGWLCQEIWCEDSIYTLNANSVADVREINVKIFVHMIWKTKLKANYEVQSYANYCNNLQIAEKKENYTNY